MGAKRRECTSTRRTQGGRFSAGGIVGHNRDAMSLPATALALVAVLALAATVPQDSRVPEDSFDVDLSAKE